MMVMRMARRLLAVLKMRRMRTTRKRRSTRMTEAGSGKSFVGASEHVSTSMSESTTSVKSKRFQLSLKYCAGPRPSSLSDISMM